MMIRCKTKHYIQLLKVRLRNIALDKQIYIYSVDTSAFFTETEKQLEDERHRCMRRKSQLKKENDIITKVLNDKKSSTSATKELQRLFHDKTYMPTFTSEQAEANTDEIRELNKAISGNKKNLIASFPNTTGIRMLDERHLTTKSVVSVFDSSLTRTASMNVNQLYEDIIIVQTYYYDIVESIILNGFMCRGEKYICLTASAGQIRTKKTVFIKESLWEQCKDTLLCGLTIESINDSGGVNINKFLAYLALHNSATDEWIGFDIDRCIVVEDMETLVNGVVDYINYETYEIVRQCMDVPVAHTDGCGMILPTSSRKNFMVRLPWVKGLLAVFPFDLFIRNHDGATSKIVDIYGREYDIFDDRIEVILTKSQFKMWKYYSSWDEYKDCFKRYSCSAGKCNIEESQYEKAKINYQMLQTLADISDDELHQIAQTSTNIIGALCSDRNTMLKVFGATTYNHRKNPFQEALLLYPELLQDEYTKGTLKEIKNSLQHDAWAAKLEVDGYYTFIIPDLYAVCEWLFLHNDNPQGLLRDNEVSCSLFPTDNKLDCLRSPHLFCEHPVRINKVSDEKSQWFTTSGLYTSVHDLISKILMFDVDGDKSLVCADPTMIEVAERNMRDVVPLYYEMKKAGAQPVDNRSIYGGLVAAYKGGRIGEISNLITKIWNSDNIDYDLIKLMCLYTNFNIDYAKTLYKPVLPDHISQLARIYDRSKTPHFFMYAKKKTKFQVEAINESCVNRLQQIVPNIRFNFIKDQLGKFDYRMLMHDPAVDITSTLAHDVIDNFSKLSKCSGRQLRIEDDEHNNVGYVAGLIVDDMLKLVDDRRYITDILVKQLFFLRNSKRKNMFWECFGDIVVANLRHNLDSRSAMCKTCGKRFMRDCNSEQYCERHRGYQQTDSKNIVCIDCGKSIVINGNNKTSKRCADCQKLAIRALKTAKQRQYRLK